MVAVQKEYIRRHKGAEVSSKSGIYFRDFHKLTMEGDYEYPVHTHYEYELIYVDKGPYRCSLNGCELSVQSGYLLIIKPGDTHQDHLVDGQFHYVLHFTMDFPLFSEDVKPEGQVSVCRMKNGSRFFNDLEGEEKIRDGFGGCMQDALLEVFFWRSIRLLERNKLSSALQDFSERQRFVRLLEKTFENNYMNDTGVDDIAAMLDVSRRTLSSRCREYLGCSPAKAFMNYRLEKAISMLVNTGETVQHISSLLGFDNQFHFSRAFKRVYGVSPSQYRKGTE